MCSLACGGMREWKKKRTYFAAGAQIHIGKIARIFSEENEWAQGGEGKAVYLPAANNTFDSETLFYFPANVCSRALKWALLPVHLAETSARCQVLFEYENSEAGGWEPAVPCSESPERARPVDYNPLYGGEKERGRISWNSRDDGNALVDGRSDRFRK